VTAPLLTYLAFHLLTEGRRKKRGRRAASHERGSLHLKQRANSRIFSATVCSKGGKVKKEPRKKRKRKKRRINVGGGGKGIRRSVSKRATKKRKKRKEGGETGPLPKKREATRLLDKGRCGS